METCNFLYYMFGSLVSISIRNGVGPWNVWYMQWIFNFRM